MRSWTPSRSTRHGSGVAGQDQGSSFSRMRRVPSLTPARGFSDLPVLGYALRVLENGERRDWGSKSKAFYVGPAGAVCPLDRCSEALSGSREIGLRPGRRRVEEAVFDDEVSEAPVRPGRVADA